ncbi:MAG: hypothetical protein U9P79_01335 [Candidatus Cloacimonadota bacterium]|nr:hypothetical protein [Candidatus Cloacimonadota bacterium]
MNRNKFFLILLLLIFVLVSQLFCYSDEQIINMKLQRASFFERQNQTEKAESLYKELVMNYPHNEKAVTRLIRFYFNTRNYKKLDELLQKEKDYLKINYYFLTKIRLFLVQNQERKANLEAEKFINLNPKNYSVYDQIARVYAMEHLFEEAEEFYLEARKVSKTQTIYARQLAEIYKAQMDYEHAIKEYFSILDVRSYGFVKYSLENLRAGNKMIIEELQDRQGESEDNLFRKLLAEFYVRNREYDRAFKIYKNLDVNSMLQFASIAVKGEQFDLAISVYEEILKNDKIDVVMKFGLYKNIADLYFLTHRYSAAEGFYKRVVHLQTKGMKNRSKLNLLIFESLVELIEIKYTIQDSIVEARKYILQARKLSVRSKYGDQLDLLLGDCFLHESKYDKAKDIFQNIVAKIKGKDNEFSYQAKYKLYLTDILVGNYTESDSLFEEFTAENSANEYFNDFVKLHNFTKNSNLKSADDSLKTDILNFLFNLETPQLHKTEMSFQKLLVSAKNEDVKYFCTFTMANYFYNNLYYDKALKIYLQLALAKSVMELPDSTNVSEPDTSPDYSEFISKRIGDCYYYLEKFELATSSYEKYLKEFPNGAFAPEIRQKLE